MVNSTNYGNFRNSFSVHTGRVNVNNRFHQQAYMKAARAPLGGDSIFLMQPVMMQPQCCHMSGFAKTMMTINTGITSFLAGFGLTSGQGNSMPMVGGGMPGMNGGMPGMNGGMPGMSPWWGGGFFG